MSRTPTPRTDRAQADQWPLNQGAVSADFARILERELDATQADLTHITTGAHDGEESRLLIICRLERDLATMTRERDAARAQADNLSWQSGKCEGIAKGLLKPDEFAPEGMEPCYKPLHALIAVSQMAKERDALRAFVVEVSRQRPEKPDYRCSCGQCERSIEDAREVLEP